MQLTLLSVQRPPAAVARVLVVDDDGARHQVAVVIPAGQPAPADDAELLQAISERVLTGLDQAKAAHAARVEAQKDVPAKPSLEIVREP